jgi:molybdenum cofactor biosynthesis enzyme MoaA
MDKNALSPVKIDMVSIVRFNQRQMPQFKELLKLDLMD